MHIRRIVLFAIYKCVMGETYIVAFWLFCCRKMPKQEQEETANEETKRIYTYTFLVYSLFTQNINKKWHNSCSCCLSLTSLRLALHIMYMHCIYWKFCLSVFLHVFILPETNMKQRNRFHICILPLTFGNRHTDTPTTYTVIIINLPFWSVYMYMCTFHAQVYVLFIRLRDKFIIFIENTCFFAINTHQLHFLYSDNIDYYYRKK